MPKTKRLTQFEKGFTQGFICALTTMIRSHGCDTPIVDAWACNRITKADFKRYGIDEYDIEILEQHWDELNKTPFELRKENNT